MIEIWENVCNFLTFCKSGVETAYMGTELYKGIGAIIRGETGINKFEQTQNTRSQQIERLAENILYAPSIYVVQDLSRISAQQRIEELRELKMALEPVQRAVGRKILSSATIITPDKLQKSMGNPWKTLNHISPIRPGDFPSVPYDPHLVPILFMYGSEQFVGWQQTGGLYSQFDLDYDENRWFNSQIAPPSSPLPENPEEGRVTYRNGSYYIGETRNGKANGWGTKFFPDGTGTVSGKWKDNEFLG